MTVIDKIRKAGIVPVVVMEDKKDAAPLAEALLEGGISCAEITFRTPAAAEAIQFMSEKFPELLVGAGTVLTTEQVDIALTAGAKFIVSPGINPRVVNYCMDRNTLMIPGVSSASNIEQALELGVKVVKFFPAEPSGGLAMVKALAAPYKEVEFMPTGGISKENVQEYLAYDRVVACGGSWMVKEELIKAGDFKTVAKLVKEAAEIAKKVRG